ncbi:response regulator transcription factor [Candidatus Nomurabacteria bacterium]|nr:response regulator transcription factor [Candidatus Nomurabacteria bacterium]
MRILIIEDQEKLAESIKKGLENLGYAVDAVHDGVKGLRRIEASPENFDLIILDIMLPELDGLSLCKKIRSQGIMTPVLMLTAKDTLENKVDGLDVGADDYLVKPFEFTELTARIRALLRRPKKVLETELEGAGIKLNTVEHTVEKKGKPIKLTVKEFAMLEFFLRHKNQVLSRDKIIAHIWDFSYDTFSNIVDVNIRNIRKKLQSKNENILETIYGVGYRFNA